MQDLSQRIQETERRFAERQERRGEREGALESRGGGGDWRRAEDPGRLARRLVELGRTETAARLLAGETVGGEGAAVDTLERIIGANELIGANFLYRGAAVARSVGRVEIRSRSGAVLGFGTGFKVSPRLMMTNNHVLGDAGESRDSVLQLDFFLLGDGRPNPTVEVRLRPDLFFHTDRRLDFTLVAVQEDETLRQRPVIGFSEGTVEAVVGERVNIVQHPGGRPQMLSLRENRVVDVLDDFLHYVSDTEQGSSGAPVFDDFWRLAALHHSGVPSRDEQGRILLQDGRVWDGGRSTQHLIAWVANEGIRISRIVEHLRRQLDGLSDERRAVLEEALGEDSAPVSGPSTGTGSGESDLTVQPVPDGQGTYRVVVPLELSLRLPRVTVEPPAGPATPAAGPGEPTTPAGPTGPSGPTEPTAPTEPTGPTVGPGEPPEASYYDQVADEEAQRGYYGEQDLPGDRREAFQRLSRLVRETQTSVLSYRSARLDHLYPRIDLRVEGDLRSVYSGKGFDPQELIALDLEIEARREARLQEFLLSESALDEAAREQFLEDLEAEMPFNCEHVVPQSWFGRRSPMKTDLHHLFTCEPRCNSFRSNVPYFQFTPEDEVVRAECGRRETGKFEPEEGKGAVARATLYFLLRYPGTVGDENRELQRGRLAILLDWHRRFPADVWEKHRNAEIARVQGNRNPLIDRPEWASQIDFGPGFGS